MSDLAERMRRAQMAQQQGLLSHTPSDRPTPNQVARGMADGLQTAGLLAAPIPVLGDAVGLLGDAAMYAAKPEERNWKNFALTGVGMLPFVPAIVPPLRAKALQSLMKLPADETFSAAVKNTPSAQVTDDGLLMRVMRNQRPEQGMADSVRGGVFYLPEGSAQAKHYTTGKNGYGGSERIEGETLLRNPLFVKGATGGRAPETAYDTLLGKGAYGEMRNAALRAYGPYGSNTAARAQLAEEFLATYAPEMSGRGRYIVENSGQGNQLAYALQEAAVGSAARKAGHDGVLGYSKGKSGPFLSELFDVRESAYPDKFGGYRVWADE